MPSPEDIADRKLSLKLFLGLVAAVVIAGALIFFLLGPAIVTATASGIDLRTAALIAAGVSFAAIIVMAVAAGDSLLGELQYMLLGFGAFFLISWLMIAWIF